MQIQELPIKNILDKISDIKKIDGRNIYTNYFMNNMNQEILKTAAAEKTIVFWDKDTDFCRCYFFSKDIDELKTALNTDINDTSVIDFLTKNEMDNEITEAFTGAGYVLYKSLERLVNNNLPVFDISPDIQFAEEKEWPQITNLLYEGLDKYTGHFCGKDELIRMINNKQIIVIRKENVVTGFIMFQIFGKKAHFYQWYSTDKNSPQESADMYTNLYGALSQINIKNAYLWVEDDNSKVRRVHKNFGFKPDNLKDYIFIKDKKNE